MDYRDVEDPSIFFKLKARKDFNKVSKDDFFLVWTTTPWCIPGNLAIAVGKDIEYSRVEIENEFYWIATERLHELDEFDIKEIETSIGKDLIGAEYVPAYSEFEDENLGKAFKLIHSDDTNTASGSGLVSQAPAYGESDFYSLKNAGISRSSSSEICSSSDFVELSSFITSVSELKSSGVSSSLNLKFSRPLDEKLSSTVFELFSTP